MPAQSVVLSPHDPDWARHFEAERALLERVLAPWLEGGIEHVGSTAIPGVAAKPIVDMVAGVRDLEEAREAYEPLEAAGYVDEPHRPEIAHHFAKPALELDRRRFNLHLTVARKLVALLVAVVALGGGSARGGGSPVALVTAETQNQLLAIELPSGHVLKRLRMPADPENVAVAGGKRAVVVSPRAGAVTVVATPSLRIVRVLRGFVSPHIVTATADLHGAYVTDDGSGRLAVIRLSGRPRVVRRIFVGAGAHHLSVSPSGNELWIALGERARTIAVLDVSDPWRPQVERRFDPGFAAHDVGFSSDWRVWVTAADRRFVTVFDSRTLRPVARLAAGAPPQHVAFGPIRGAFVTSGYGGSLEIVDRFSGRVLRRVRVPYGSFNVATFGSFVVTSSLLRGTLTELTDRGAVLMSRHYAPAARGVAVAVFSEAPLAVPAARTRGSPARPS